MEIYLLTRLDAIKEAFEIMFVISSLIVVFAGVGALIACETPTIFKPLKRILMVSITTAILASFILWFVFLFTGEIYSGIGGKGGTTAALSTIVTIIIMNFFS